MREKIINKILEDNDAESLIELLSLDIDDIISDYCESKLQKLSDDELLNILD